MIHCQPYDFHMYNLLAQKKRKEKSSSDFSHIQHISMPFCCARAMKRLNKWALL